MISVQSIKSLYQTIDNQEARQPLLPTPVVLPPAPAPLQPTRVQVDPGMFRVIQECNKYFK